MGDSSEETIRLRLARLYVGPGKWEGGMIGDQGDEQITFMDALAWASGVVASVWGQEPDDRCLQYQKLRLLIDVIDAFELDEMLRVLAPGVEVERAFRRIRKRLAAFLDSEDDINRWLSTPQVLLNGDRPAALIQQGHIVEVEAAIDQLESGACV